MRSLQCNTLSFQTTRMVDNGTRRAWRKHGKPVSWWNQRDGRAPSWCLKTMLAMMEVKMSFKSAMNTFKYLEYPIFNREYCPLDKDDIYFVLRDQWTASSSVHDSLVYSNLRWLSIKLYDSTKKVVVRQRKNKPDLIVRSLTGKATQEQINLRADLVRTISYQSQNDLVIKLHLRAPSWWGFGAFQVLIDYEAPRSFNKHHKIRHYHLMRQAVHGSHCIKATQGWWKLLFKAFRIYSWWILATYPYVLNPVSYVDPYMLLDFQWTTRDTIIVCDEFVKECFPLTINHVKVGDQFKVLTNDEWKMNRKNYKKKLDIAGMGEARSIIEKDKPIKVGERQTQDYKIMHYRLIRDRIIDFSVWPSRQLPIPFVDGDSYYIEGRQYTKSFIHEARDAQKLLNYSRSETAAELKNRRRDSGLEHQIIS